jgi:hypothetical protein
LKVGTLRFATANLLGVLSVQRSNPRSAHPADAIPLLGTSQCSPRQIVNSAPIDTNGSASASDRMSNCGRLEQIKNTLASL